MSCFAAGALLVIGLTLLVVAIGGLLGWIEGRKAR